MDFETIRNAIKDIQFADLRYDCNAHFEAVFVKEEMDKLITCLESFLGPPIFPSKNRLSLEMKRNINAYGGIISGQTLYYSTQGSDTFFAMLWPWSDGQHTTVKIIKK